MPRRTPGRQRQETARLQLLDQCAPLNPNQRKAHFSYAYVQAIASQAGHAISPVPQDVDSLAFDVTMEFAEAGIRLELKCSAVRRFNKAGTLQFPVEEAWVNKWGVNNNPVYCILVMVPSALDEWINHPGPHEAFSSQSIVTMMRASAYWTRVDRLDPDARSITFQRRHRFTADTVRLWRDNLHRGYRGQGGSHV